MVFCIDYTSSITSYYNAIRAMIIFICIEVLRIPGDVRLGLIKFRSFHDLWSTNVHGFTSDINEFQQWLGSDQPGGGSPDGDEAVGKKINLKLTDLLLIYYLFLIIISTLSSLLQQTNVVSYVCVCANVYRNTCFITVIDILSNYDFFYTHISSAFFVFVRV